MVTRVLILPGYQNSGPKHWQSLWQEQYPNVTRVMQKDWDGPWCNDWLDELTKVILSEPTPVILVAHSLGCLLSAAVVRASNESVLQHIQGALLVAPPDPAGVHFPASLNSHGFLPDLTHAMPFPSIVVASSDDPYGSLAFAKDCAQQWGSQFVNMGDKGHINSDSGLGDWPLAWTWIQPWLMA